jgi:hypothetical protein
MSATNTTLKPAVIGLTLTCASRMLSLRTSLISSSDRSHVSGSDVWYDDATECRIGEQHECKRYVRVCRDTEFDLGIEQAVERVLYYASEQLPQERAHIIPETEPGESWPERGQIEFKDVVMSYREGLPTVLNGM